ncbi:MAG TPA: pyridoxine 5'-phosphate synthase [Tepidisphaeraceae bacterium]|nr:pyridoxine 5'-phosphate synthase [Tepidisphaeraceae bacterium]
MTKLSVNLNRVALLRNTRPVGIPSVVHAAKLVLDAGAHGITVHPRPDQRHIRPADVRDLAELLKNYPGVEFNIEGNPFFDYMPYAQTIRPTQCTLVPDSPEASTSDHGWDLMRDGKRLQPVVDQLKSLGCRVSIFMDPQPAAMDLAAKLGVDRVELYTAPYAEDFAKGNRQAAEPYALAARRAGEVGLGVNAGHDLNLQNLRPFLEAVPNVLEVSIGHALIAEALEFGLPETVRKYLAIVSNG